MDYYLTTVKLVIFGDKMYVTNSSDLKKVILKKFHVKPYSCHPSYHKTFTRVKRFYYCSNLKRDVAEFVARCFDCQHVKGKCKRLGGMLYMIVIPKWKWM